MGCGDCPPNDDGRGLGGRLLHGAAGVAKAMTGIDRGDEAQVRIRRRTCFFCDQAQPCAGIVGRACECSACKCIIRAKTAIASEHCPLAADDASPATVRRAVRVEGRLIVHGACICKWCSAEARYFAAVAAGRCPVTDDGRPSEPGPDGRCACRHCEGIRAAIAARSNAG